MAQVFISIGSNIEPEINIPDCIRMLERRFGQLLLSPVYESEPVGFVGANFYNMVIGLDTKLTPDELVDYLHTIESGFDRSRDTDRFSSRTLDLDLLLYNDLILENDNLSLPREEILKYAFVLRPLADIVGNCTHPVTGKSYSELWREFDQKGVTLRQVNILEPSSNTQAHARRGKSGR
jgi:2-amino-4-hydroxy-6-hydroxymethyldihydropteridine diphosphokinase